MNIYVETFGCQMNDRDSEIMVQILEQEGFQLSDDMAASQVIIVNTCSIRAKAEQKAYSLLGSLRRLKKDNPDILIAATGCVAQQEGEKMVERMPHIDLVLGPQAIYDIGRLLIEARETGRPRVVTGQQEKFTIPPFLPDLRHGQGHKRFLTIMQGCNNFCTYCIVPFTRGREVSRAPADILAEARHLIDHGVQEITLLGQNVNSYGNDLDGSWSFPRLLQEVSALPGLTRLRFTTSNPKDLSPALMACFADLANLCHHFHLPLQSGSDTILSRMNRKYSVESYLELVAGLREKCADLALTTDIIVGFPGETEADFLKTMDVMETVRYHGAFSFIYSHRPPARSCSFVDKTPLAEKKERLAHFQKRQKEITLELHQHYVGQIMEAMIESPERNSQGQWCGRVSQNQIVNFVSGEKYKPGEIVRVKITEGLQNSLRGEALS